MPLISAPCAYIHLDAEGRELAKGEGEVQLEAELLSLLPKFGETIFLSLVDIAEIMQVDYRLNLGLQSEEKLSLSEMGYRLGDFVTNLSAARNEMILKFLLMNESIRKGGVSGELDIAYSSGSKKRFENCRLRLYETSVVFVPATGEDPIRIHYGNIAKSEGRDYALIIITESGDTFTFSKMGGEFDATVRDMSAAMNDLNLQSQALVKSFFSLADPSVVREISRLLKDGKAAKRAAIESASPEVWTSLEKLLEQTPVWSGYQFLKSMARPENIAAGIKRGLMGDLTGNYVWVLIPIYGGNRAGGNAIALEAVRVTPRSAEDTSGGTELEVGGNATYFFRIAGRQDYPGLDEAAMDALTDVMIRKINQAMLDINFRREPILLTDDQLRDPKYARYRYAANKLDSLKTLRALYIGRVIHSSPDQWRADVTDLLSFNAASKEDGERWKKA